MLRAIDIHHSYGEREVLRGVSLEVTQGEVLALLGPSGSGKSTLLYCLAGVLVPSAGSVLVGDLDLVTADDDTRTRARRETFGFVLQFGRLVGELTAVENASIPLRLLGRRRREAEAAAREALAAVGVADLAGRRASTLSGGEQQRVAVARALIHDPAVVFADEPTGALDSANGELVMGCLVDMARERGSAVVLVTHDESIAAQAHREIRMRDGLMETAGVR